MEDCQAGPLKRLNGFPSKLIQRQFSIRLFPLPECITCPSMMLSTWSWRNAGTRHWQALTAHCSGQRQRKVWNSLCNYLIGPGESYRTLNNKTWMPPKICYFQNKVYNTHISTHLSWFSPMRTNVVLDDDLMREAFALTGIHTKRELIHTALQELIRKHTKKDLTDLAGKIQLQDDFDHKKLRELSRDTG